MTMTYDPILVTGGTGFLGRVLIDRLIAGGARVRALVLESDPAADRLPPDAERVTGDVTDYRSLEAFFGGDLSRACVIHAAGVISIATRKNPALRKVNVEGTRNIADRCAAHGAARLVSVGTVHAIPEKPKGEIMSEVSVFSPDAVRGQYAKSKAEAARIALEAAERGVSVSVAQPSGIIGPFDEKRGSITSAIIGFCQGKIRFAADGGYDFVDVRDAADGILACCEKGRSGECYILSGRCVRLREIFSHLSRAGYGREPLYLPLPVVRAAAFFTEAHSILRKTPLFLTPYSAHTLGSNALFSHEKASRELGYRPRALCETLDDTLAWLRAEGAIPAGRKSGRAGRSS